MIALHRFRRRLARDRRGSTIVEFAILLPVLVMLLLGLMDMSYMSYAKAVLEGALQKAGRDSGIENANTSTIDAKVQSVVQQVAPNATYAFSRKSYATFGSITPERYTDANHNGQYDHGECFDDINGNGVWDADPGLAGQGGANDVTYYTVTVTYPRLFPLSAILGWPSTETISASTLLKNQPYSTQAVPTVQTICT